MATRGCIAFGTPSRFQGRYHHWDSYPEGLGKALWDRFQEIRQAGGSVDSNAQAWFDRMVSELFTAHPSGWSTIVGADWSQAPGFREYQQGQTSLPNRPQCYCHGDRHEKAYRPITARSFPDSGTEYAYVIGRKRGRWYMWILDLENENGSREATFFGLSPEDVGRKVKTRVIGQFNLLGPEPNWETLTQGENLK